MDDARRADAVRGCGDVRGLLGGNCAVRGYEEPVAMRHQAVSISHRRPIHHAAALRGAGS